MTKGGENRTWDQRLETSHPDAREAEPFFYSSSLATFWSAWFFPFPGCSPKVGWVEALSTVLEINRNSWKPCIKAGLPQGREGVFFTRSGQLAIKAHHALGCQRLLLNWSLQGTVIWRQWVLSRLFFFLFFTSINKNSSGIRFHPTSRLTHVELMFLKHLPSFHHPCQVFFEVSQCC